MAGDTYPSFRVAAVQAAPVWLDRNATVEKIAALTSEAAHGGAALVVFGESFLPGFPVWNLTHRPIDQQGFFRRLWDNALLIPSLQFRKLGEIARGCGVYLSVGVTEKTDLKMGTLWNSNLIFSPEGQLVNWRRKLVATWAEKLTWAQGDASGLQAVETPLGRIGMLICGENTNTLARFALLAQGEQVHLATYPPCWPFKRSTTTLPYDLTAAIRTRAAAHSFEGKLYTVVASSVLDSTAIEDLVQGEDGIREVIAAAAPPISLVVDPTGTTVGEALVGQEGIVTADVDLSNNIEHKLVHDIIGGYQRFDLFQLKVDQTPYTHLGVSFENHDGRDHVSFVAGEQRPMPATNGEVIERPALKE